MITAIKDRLDIPVEEMKSYLKRKNFSKMEETILQSCLDSAKEQADAYCQNPFVKTDEDGTEIPVLIPQAVKIAVMQMASTMFTERNDHLSGQSVAGFSFTYGQPPWQSQRLLFPYRKLVVG